MTPYYQDEYVTIYHGDCREILPTLPPVAFVLTDPPYGIAYSPSTGGRGWGGKDYDLRKKFSGKNIVYGDAEPFDPAFLLNFPRVVLFGANHYADKLPASSGWIVWDKQCSDKSINFADCEMAWTNIKTPARMFRHVWDGVRKDSEVGESRMHPTQKPLALMVWVLCRYAEEDDVVLDPFMGSGTTLRAAKDLGRRAIGIEIEEKYCEIAAKRCEFMQPRLFQETATTIEIAPVQQDSLFAATA
jgi:site-specific DNA-methyltransferase (adenine-specific)